MFNEATFRKILLPSSDQIEWINGRSIHRKSTSWWEKLLLKRSFIKQIGWWREKPDCLMNTEQTSENIFTWVSLLGTIWYWLQEVPKCALQIIVVKFKIFYLFYYRPNLCFNWSIILSKTFLKNFQFFYSFHYRSKFYYYCPTALFESTHMNWVFIACLTQSLKTGVFTCNDLVSAAISSKKCNLNHIWKIPVF